MQKKAARRTAEARAEVKGCESVCKDKAGRHQIDHDDVVRAINNELERQDTCHLKIGEIVDQVVGPTGRADYGEQAIAKLAGDPALMCSGEHLRRCLHYYWLMRKHGEALASQYASLKYGHLYQISRLLQLEAGLGADEVTTAIHAMAHKAMADGKPIPIEALARAVTTHIKSLKRPVTAVRDGGGDGLQEESGAKAVDPSVALVEAVAGLNQAISDALAFVPTVTGDTRYRHAATLQTNAARVAALYTTLLGYIVTHDPQSLIIESARRSVIALATLVDLTVAESGAAEKSEVGQ